ncbi:MAG: porin family protein [Lysobacteraceae bacterium]|nr:MAG: porin family protein [Xanthomonadaceae bacterium]
MKHLLALSLGLALAATSINAFAADNGGFVRAEIGNSKIDAGGADGDDTSFSLRGGYFFNANFGVEGFYTNLGEDSSDGVSAEANAFGLGIVGKKNFSEEAHTGGFISGRLGVSRANTDIGVSGIGSVDDTSTQPYIGIGGGYDFSPNFGLSLNIDYMKADAFGTDLKFTTTSLGLEYRF